MDTLLLTGFPGFLGSALLPRLLARRPGSAAVCLVQPQHLATARERIAELEREHPHLLDRVELVTGDITAPDLGLDRHRPRRPRGRHRGLAPRRRLRPRRPARGRPPGQRRRDGPRPRPLPDPAAPDAPAVRQHLLRQRPVRRGVRRGRPRRGPALPQPLRVDEVRGRAAGPRRRWPTGCRPRSTGPASSSATPRTGETQKFDGPYFIAGFLRRQPGPSRSCRGSATPTSSGSAWCPATSWSTRWTRCRCWTVRSGRTYALTDPAPADGARRSSTRFAARLGKRVVWVPLPLGPTHALVDRVPGHGAAARPAGRGRGLLRLADDVLHRATRRATWRAPAVQCPSFDEYADRLLDFMREHPEIDSKAMV